MQKLRENKMQGWRALGIAHDSTRHLLMLGTSYEQLKKNYLTSFFGTLTEEDQKTIKTIQIEKWLGVADCGKWVYQDSFRLPANLKKQEIKEDEDSVI